MGGFNSLPKERNVDIVMCIDATSSMGPCIENVRRNATKFYQDFKNTMENEFDSKVTSLRVQVIAFRDLECDENAIDPSEFFELPEDSARFERHLSSIKPSGGGDFKESGLEALYTAMKTKWVAKGANDRQVIVLFSDADAIDFTEKRNRTGYPNMCSKEDFVNQWYSNCGNRNTMQERSKRLVLFAPGESVYSQLQKLLNRTQHSIVQPQMGMADITFDTIIRIICASASSV